MKVDWFTVLMVLRWDACETHTFDFDNCILSKFLYFQKDNGNLSGRSLLKVQNLLTYNNDVKKKLIRHFELKIFPPYTPMGKLYLII